MERPGRSSDSGTQRPTKATSVVKHPLSPESPVNQPPVENQTKAVTATVSPIFKTWQHPAAPFCYEPSSTFVPPFVPV
ncbi:hypothetical protein Bca52824_040856 [Brassica carinata]|uniref:Uncharacterized protein n=1 Tax=Brassica carinata TaxID=52824 RepID=A0A8X7RUA5_BRACI|nr:hypothetical protein Bca52824_040856 [Brassica carinata]